VTLVESGETGGSSWVGERVVTVRWGLRSVWCDKVRMNIEAGGGGAIVV
jgi:hypothetical protein